jgi:hypothetical protein
MPAPLWEEAVCLARQFGVNPIRVALGLSYESLRERAERREGASEAASFVEVSGGALVPATGPVIELADARGARLTIRLAAGSELDVEQLVEAFGRSRA